MTFAIANITAVLASAVVDTGTVVVPYPAGFAQADLLGSTGGMVVVNDNDKWPQDQAAGDGTVAFTFGASDITVTNNSGVTWAAGATLIASFGSRNYQDDPDMTQVYSGPTAAVIADPAGGGTADVEARAAINDIIDALQAAGIVATA